MTAVRLYTLVCPWCGATMGELPTVPNEGWLKCADGRCKERIPATSIRVKQMV